MGWSDNFAMYQQVLVCNIIFYIDGFYVARSTLHHVDNENHQGEINWIEVYLKLLKIYWLFFLSSFSIRMSLLLLIWIHALSDTDTGCHSSKQMFLVSISFATHPIKHPLLHLLFIKMFLNFECHICLCKIVALAKILLL